MDSERRKAAESARKAGTFKMTTNSIGIVVPVKDEQETLQLLFESCKKSAEELGVDFELVFVDDGSTDDSWARICALHSEHPEQVKAIRLRRNFGKAMALSVGFEVAKGDVVLTMDADLQDDPGEIGKFLRKIDDGYDCVSGWKMNRQDPRSKTLPSLIFNKITAKISGIDLHDFNCGFKAYRAEVVKSVDVYGELHRYIPILAHDYGYRIGEVPIVHHPRKYGVSKFGWERLSRGFLDLVTVMATTRYAKRPGHLYGGIGLLSGLLGTVILIYLAILWFTGNGPIGNRPLFFVGILAVIMSVQLVSLGVLAEIMIKNSGVKQGTHGLVSARCPPTPA